MGTFFQSVNLCTKLTDNSDKIDNFDASQRVSIEFYRVTDIIDWVQFIDYNRTYNEILDRDWFSARLFVT